MDGIASKEGVIMLASTNRADVLDKVKLPFLIEVSLTKRIISMNY
jgi:AAA+ superfamily predicted ATPase